MNVLIGNQTAATCNDASAHLSPSGDATHSSSRKRSLRNFSNHDEKTPVSKFLTNQKITKNQKKFADL